MHPRIWEPWIRKTFKTGPTRYRFQNTVFLNSQISAIKIWRVPKELSWWSRASQRPLETKKHKQTHQRNVKGVRFQSFEVNWLDELQFSHTSKKSHQMKLFCWSMASQRPLETIKKTQESTQTKQRNVKDPRFQFFEVNLSECAYIFKYLQENPTNGIILVVYGIPKAPGNNPETTRKHTNKAKVGWASIFSY